MTEHEGLRAYGILVDASLVPDEEPARWGPVRTLPRYEPTLFGREEEQRRLSDWQHPTVVLYGESGSGRSALAAWVARQAARETWHDAPERDQTFLTPWRAESAVVRIDASSGALDLILMDFLAALGHPSRDLLRLARSDDPGALVDLLHADWPARAYAVVLEDVPDFAALSRLTGAFGPSRTSLVATCLPMPGLEEPRTTWHAQAVGPLSRSGLSRALRGGDPATSAYRRLQRPGSLPPELRLPALLPLLRAGEPRRTGRRTSRNRSVTVAELAETVLGRLSPGALRALNELAPWAGIGLTKETAEALGVPSNAWSELCSRGLFQSDGSLFHTLHPALCAALGLTASPAERAALDRRAAEAVRARLSPSHSVKWPAPVPLVDDALLDLARRLAPNSPDAAGELFPLLARHWWQQGDFHRLVVLARLDHHHRVHACGRELALAQRDVGLLRPAMYTLSAPRSAPGDAARPNTELASVLHHQGHMGKARAALGDDASGPPGDPEALLALAAIESDQGRLSGVDALLQYADSATPHGERQTQMRILLERARVLLRRGRPIEAQQLLDQNTTELQGHVMTELGRALVLQGHASGAVPTLTAALDKHRANEDLRGVAWTHYYLGLAHARTANDREQHAARSFLTALARFVELPDQQGVGWSLYRLYGLSHAEGKPFYRVDDAVLLGRMTEALNSDDSPRGAAWAQLLRAPYSTSGPRGRRVDRVALNRAALAFEALDDGHGHDWARLLLHVEDGDLTAAEQVVRRLGRASGGLSGLAPGSRWHAFLAQARTDPLSHRALVPDVPFLAMELSSLRPPARDADQPPTPRCHIRVTLQDDSPAPGAASQLLVRVQPDPAHPWHDRAAAPWLTVVATPLTRARTEPPSATLRPSGRVMDGARFDFTPHTAGVHLIRFTVLDPVTDTVLQRVRVELDVPPQNGPRPLSAPPRVALPVRYGGRARTPLARPTTHRPAVQNPLTPRPSEKA
ncbi:hypothetical protein [Streptomyces sp. NPDC050504]|uniref:hypothetical protein n=1 Tax=Streptomyces sp. NPDC050504 TaxID=3365618 RepID=UPI00379FB05B